MKKLILSLLLAMGLASAARAEGPFIGKVTRTDTSATGYLVEINSGPVPSCGGAAAYVILAATASNFKTFVALLAQAQSGGAEVHLYATYVGAPGFCNLDYVVVR